MALTKTQVHAYTNAARKQVEVCSAKLVTLVTSLASVDSIATATHELLVARGTYKAWDTVQAAMERNRSPENMTRFLIGLLSRDADDSWSGRGNDARRSYHDGFHGTIAKAIEA